MIHPDNNKMIFRIFLATLLILAVFSVFIYGASYNHPGYDYYFHLKRFEALISALQDGRFPIYADYTASLDMLYTPFLLFRYYPYSVRTHWHLHRSATGIRSYAICDDNPLRTIYVQSREYYLQEFLYGIHRSILYTFSVYRLIDIYPRGALGEVFAFTFLPIVFWGLYHIIKGNYHKWYVIAIGFSLLIFSHIISTVLAFITVVIVLIIYYKPLIKEPKRILYLMLAGVTAVAITSSYIFPLFEQLSSNTFLYENNDWSLPSRTKLPLLHLLWALFCGFVFPKDIMVTGIGILLTLSIFIRFFIKGKPEGIKSVDIGVFIGLFYILASSSLFPWGGRFPFSLLSFIQYPTRFYLFVTCFFAVAAAFYLSAVFVKSRQRQVIALVIVVCTIFTMYMHSENYKYMHRTYINQTNEKPVPGNFFYLNGGEYVPARVRSANYVQARGGDSVISKFGNLSIDKLRERKGL